MPVETTSDDVAHEKQPADKPGWASGASLWVVVGIVGACLLLRGQISGRLDSPAFLDFATRFVSLMVQATPFLVFGVLISAAISAFVPASALQRLLPENKALAVPVAGAAGALLPGCECASVPISGSLIRRGIAPAAALTFLLAAPAINPVVLVSTAVAFPNRPDMVIGRFVASFAVAIIMGWLWLRFGKAEWLSMGRRTPHDHDGEHKLATFRDAMQHDFLHAGGFLVVGAGIAAAFNTFVPKDIVDTVADNWILAVLALVLLAFLVAICSEADAFVAASFVGFSDTAKLAFMVVGPAVDVKLASMQAGTFGHKFALRFAPATLVVATLSAVIVGWVLL